MNRFSRETSAALAAGLLLLVLAILAPSFYRPAPLLSLAAREAPALVIVAGMALIIIARQIDISVASQFAVCSVCAGLLLQAHWSNAVTVLVTLAMGAAMGAFNGALVAGLGLPSIVVTLATMVTWREAIRWQSQGRFINLPGEVQWFGLSQTAGQAAILVVALLFFFGTAWITKHLAVGRHVYAIGSNEEAARLAGLRPRLLTFALFTFMGALAASAAFLNLAQSPQVDPKSGTGLELRAIAACVVGGVAIAGGRGTIGGAVIGLLLLACTAPALTHLRIEPYWERAIQGLIILLAVVGDRLRVPRFRSEQQEA